MKNVLKRVKKSPVTRTRGQAIGSHVRGKADSRATNPASSWWNWSSDRALGDEPFPLCPQSLATARRTHDAERLLDLHEDVGHQDRRRDVPGQLVLVDAAIVVFRPGIEQEEVGQPLLGEESLQVPLIRIDDAGCAPMRHEEPGDLTGPAVLVNPQELPDANRQGETLAAGCVQQAPEDLARHYCPG